MLDKRRGKTRRPSKTKIMQTHDTFTTHLGTDFKFRFVQSDSAVEIFIEEQPSYAGRSDDQHTTHRLETDQGTKICWTGQITTLADAKKVCAAWCFYTERYVLTGQKFPTH